MSLTLTPEEREHAAGELSRTAEEFLAAAREAGWAAKPSEGWGTAEICEHIWRTHRGVLLTIRRTKESDGTPAVNTEEMVAKVRARGNRAQAPEPVRPAGAFPTYEEFAAQFDAVVAGGCEYIQTTQDALHARFIPHAAIGTMDSYQWILFLAAHCERHTKQLREAISG